MANTLLMVVHQKTSVTGRVGARLLQRGYRLDVRCPMEGQPLPERLDHIRGVVVFGGPMSANDEHLDGIRAELDWLPRVLAQNKPYLGICLGAQLMARALGATVRPHPAGRAEIGYYPVRPARQGCDLFDAPMHVYHWHREGFDIPAGATRLAVGETFANQAYRYARRVYGIQFHPEVTFDMMTRWTANGGDQLGCPGAQAAALHFAGHRRFDAALGAWLGRFLDHWLAPVPVAEPA